DKGITPLAAPDFSVATLFFESGMVARLTCSIVAPHDHGLRVFCDDGVISVDKAWDNNAPVKLQRRLVLRRKLIEKTRRKTYKLKGKTHPKVGRWGAASMNFALGPVEVLEAVDEGRACRLSPEFALHLTEVTLAIQNAGRDAGAQKMRSRCDVIEPMPWAQ
ncbi:MAG: oxidoreductase, partial [Rhodobacteraceae bacterium]